MVQTAPLEAKIVDDLDRPENRAPGAIEFSYPSVGGRKMLNEKPFGLQYMCPCGCGVEGYLGFRPQPNSPMWNWNGDLERPTLTPSVHHLMGGKTHWHGWLTAGMWLSV